MPAPYYHPIETLREAKARARRRPDFAFSPSQERAARRRNEKDQQARKEKKRLATLKRNKKEREEQQKAEREANRRAANELISRVREGGLDEAGEGGPLRPPSSQLPLFRFFPPQRPLPAIAEIPSRQLPTPSPSRVGNPLRGQSTEGAPGLSLHQVWQMTQHPSCPSSPARSAGPTPTRPSPPLPIQPRAVPAWSLQSQLDRTLEPAATDDLHDTYDLDSSMPFSIAQWTSPRTKSPRRLQDHDMDLEEMGNEDQEKVEEEERNDKEEDEEEEEEDEEEEEVGEDEETFPLSSSMELALRNLQDEQVPPRTDLGSDEYPLSSQMELAFQGYEEEPVPPRIDFGPDEYPLSSQTAAAFQAGMDTL